MNVKRAKKSQRLMKSLTGLTGEEFEDLSKRFSDTYIQVESAKSNRKRKFGGPTFNFQVQKNKKRR